MDIIRNIFGRDALKKSVLKKLKSIFKKDITTNLTTKDKLKILKTVRSIINAILDRKILKVKYINTYDLKIFKENFRFGICELLNHVINTLLTKKYIHKDVCFKDEVEEWHYINIIKKEIINDIDKYANTNISERGCGYYQEFDNYRLKEMIQDRNFIKKFYSKRIIVIDKCIEAYLKKIKEERVTRRNINI
jgi:hypothetical protein